jgi:hypothetical protein
MTYRWLADATVVLHLAFIVFVVLGSVLVWRRPAWAWLHVPAIAWVGFIEFTATLCPLTPLENALRTRAGDAGYAGGFIEHYLIPIIYPPGLTPGIQFALGMMVVALNALAYWAIWRRRRAATALESS